MKYDPHTIGYWARVEGVSKSTALSHPHLGDALGSRDAQQSFDEGWAEAEAEIEREKVEALIARLDDVES